MVVCAAEQRLYELIGRLFADGFGRIILQRCATVHDQHARAKTQRFVDIMGDKQDGDAGFPVDTGDLILQGSARDLIHRAERLIHQQQVGGGGERARNADALLLSAGKLIRIALAQRVVQTDDAHPFPYSLRRALFVSFVQ